MITRENLVEAAEKYENLTVEFVDDLDDPYWEICITDPDECDEDIVVAKLYEESWALEVIHFGIMETIIGSDQTISEITPECLIEMAIGSIYETIKETVSYYECILDELDNIYKQKS